MRRAWCIAFGLGLVSLSGLMVQAQSPRLVYDVRTYGAKGDGHALDTRAVQKALDACAAAGGGTVWVPPGIYLAGTLHLRSHVTIYLENGAELRQSKNMDDYEKPAPTCYVFATSSKYVFLHGVDVRHVAIRGDGVINGNLAMDHGDRGPLPILFEHSTDILLEDITVVDSPGWCITVFGCQRVAFVRVKSLNSFADGINPVCSQDVLYDGVLIEGSGDDAITIKNESAASGRPPCGFLSQNIIVTNTTVRKTTHPAVKFGTGTSGVFRNIHISNCTFEDTGAMFTIQLMRLNWPGETERLIENVSFSNIVTRNCLEMFDITSMDVVQPVIRNLSISHVIADGMKRASRIHGLRDAPVLGVSLSDIRVGYAGSPTSAWLHTRHVNDLRMRDVRLDVDGRIDSGLFFENGSNIEMHGVELVGLTNKAPAIRIESVDGIRLCNSVAPAVDTYVQADGKGLGHLSFIGMDMRLAKQVLSAGLDLPVDAVYPQARTIVYHDLSVSETIMPNEPFQVRANLTNTGGGGFVRAEVNIEGRLAGGKWQWMEQGESRQIELPTAPFYRPGKYRLTVGSLSAEAEVRPAPAAFVYGERMEAITPAAAGELTRITVPVKNIGGARGHKEIALYSGEQAVMSQTVTLDPGEEKWVALEHRFTDSGARLLRVGDWPAWPFATFANTEVRFAQTRERLIIDAGGDKGELLCNGPYVTAYIPRVEGDFVASVCLLSQRASSPKAAAGLVVRNDLTRQGADSPALALTYIEPKYGGSRAWQSDCDGDGKIDTTYWGGGGYPSWFMLEKRGKDFTSYTSPDGRLWRVSSNGGPETEDGREGICTIPSAAEAQDVGLFTYADSINHEMAHVELKSFRLAKPIPLPDVEFNGLEISNTEPAMTDEFTVRAKMTNRSAMTGPAKAKLLFSGLDLMDYWIDLKPGESRQVEFKIMPEMTQSYLWCMTKGQINAAGSYKIMISIGNIPPASVTVKTAK